MVPAAFSNFFLATAGAGGALIGLLFVAISINPDRIFGADAALERQAVARGAFTALVNAFFTSCAALIPGESLGPVATAMALIGLINTIRVGFDLLLHQIRRIRRERMSLKDIALGLARAITLVLLSAVAYGVQLKTAIHLTANPKAVDDVYTFCGLILTISGVGLVRAWELLGAPREGFTGFLNPLADLGKDRARPAAASEDGSAQAAKDAPPAPGVAKG